jgi:hypothetical protein
MMEKVMMVCAASRQVTLAVRFNARLNKADDVDVASAAHELTCR